MTKDLKDAIEYYIDEGMEKYKLKEKDMEKLLARALWSNVVSFEMFGEMDYLEKGDHNGD